MSRWILPVLLVVQASLLTYSARVHSPTWDETGHLAAGLSHWELGEFELYSVNPPLVRTVAAAPVYFFTDAAMDWEYYRSDPKLRTEVYLGRRLMQDYGEGAYWFFFLARLAVLPIAMLGTWICYLWARDLFDRNAGFLAAAVWVFSPSVLAYGSVITPDLASAVAGLGASYVTWRWLKTPGWGWAGFLGVSLGLAVLTKSIWLMLPFLVLLVWLASALFGKAKESFGARLNQFAQVAAAGIVAVLMLNFFYGFAGSFKPLGEYQFVSRMMVGDTKCEECDSVIGNRFSEGVLAGLPVPVPGNFLQGIDIQRRDFERGMSNPSWQSYLFGTWSQGGWWYYYAVGLFVKVPLVTWCLLGAASAALMFWKADEDARKGLLCLWVPVFAVFVLLSANTGLNRYVRYALPVLPALVIWASYLGSLAARRGRVAQGALGAACCCLAFVSVSNAPNWLSYFNAAAGGSAGGQAVLCDSNVDWGQDLALLKGWLEEHPDAAGDLHLAAFASYDPASVGIDFKLPPPLYKDSAERLHSVQCSLGPKAGWFVISKNFLVGHSMPVPDGRDRMQFEYYDEPVFSYFQGFEPVDRIGGSMLVYHLEPGEVDEARKRLGLPLLYGGQEMFVAAR